MLFNFIFTHKKNGKLSKMKTNDSKTFCSGVAVFCLFVCFALFCFLLFLNICLFMLRRTENVKNIRKHEHHRDLLITVIEH